MSESILLNQNWQFHMGELTGSDRVKKITNKAGMSGGASNLTRKEGFTLRQSKIITQITKREDGLYDVMGISQDLIGPWQAVDLPHDWMFRQPYRNQNQEIAPTDVLEAVVDNPGYFTHGVAYYRKVFPMPERCGKRRVRLEFDGVMHNCDVWLNGHYLGGHISGYTSFSFDITEYLNEINTLLVRTDSHGNEGWWYEGAGIYRDVRLVIHSRVSLQKDGLWTRLDEVTHQLARGKLVAEIENTSFEDAEASIVFTVISPEGESLCLLSGVVAVKAFSQEMLELNFELENPRLWDLDSPVMYTARAEVTCGGMMCDTSDTAFGIRRVDYVRQGLILNDRLTEIKGVCEHQDFAGVGTALTEDIMLYKVRCFKQMGANAIRSAHHPMTRAMLDICDREGMLVLNENRHFSVNPESMEGLRQLVRDSRNHPSIFMYCLENEEFLTHTSQGKALLRRMVEWVKFLDPTRLVTMAGMIAKDDPEYVTIPEVAGFNYDGGDAAVHLKSLENLRVMATEDSNTVSARGVYEDDREKGWCSSYDSGPYTAETMDAGTFGGASSTGRLAFAWDHNRREIPELGGVFIWTGMDYRGESYPWYWPSIGSQHGAMDICGFPKDAYYHWQSVWLERPVVHVLPHWNWPGREGQLIAVETFCNCEEIELTINGVSQGTKKNRRGEIGRWYVEYQPGELRVVGYNGGKASVEHRRRTFGEVHEIRMEPLFTGERLVLIKTVAYDINGNFCETADTVMTFGIAGGEFIGCGNGDPSSHEDDAKPERKLFNGLALVIVKPCASKTALTACYNVKGREKRCEFQFPQ